MKSTKAVQVVSAGVERASVDEATKELFSYDGLRCRETDLGAEVTVDGFLQGGRLHKWDVRFKDASGGMHRGCIIKRRHSDELVHVDRRLVKLKASDLLHSGWVHVWGLPSGLPLSEVRLQSPY